ncbi:MAG TPA: hypothetical protein VIL46_04100, partial [Gemmataceae bacterium]
SNTIDPTQGILTPFYENNNRITTCPSLVEGQVKSVYQGHTGGYGYNRALGTTIWVAPNWTKPLYYVRRITDIEATSATFLFSDSALIATWTSPPEAQESDAIAAPFPTPFRGGDLGSPQPTTHFRHAGGLAVVAFLDGHVESRTEVPFPSPTWWTPEANALCEKIRLGYLADTNEPYEGRWR